MKSEESIWTNLNQSEIWSFYDFQTTGLKWIWKQYESNLKYEKSIWNWTRGKVNLTLSETELKGKANQTQSETEPEGEFWARSWRTWLADTIGNWHQLIPPQPLQSHTRFWTACCQGGVRRRILYHGMDITRPVNLYLMKLQQFVSHQTWGQDPFTVITKTQWSPLNWTGWNIHILLPLVCLIFGR